MQLLDCAPPTLEKVYGNDTVCAMLRKWLTVAEQGKINFCVLAMFEPPRAAAFDFAGSVEPMPVVPAVLDALKAKIEQQVREQAPPDCDPALDASYFCYQLTTGAIGFDFSYPLIAAEMDRRREGAPGPLKVGFWGGPANDFGLNTAYRAEMFNNVAVPMLGLIGAVRDDGAIKGRRGGLRLLDITNAARKGEAVPRFQASDIHRNQVKSWFLSNEKPVTITLRESEHYPHRNSNFDAWLKFADDLSSAGETVVIVRDTRMAHQAVARHTICPIASLELGARLALYEQAKLNFFVSNGPTALGWFGTAPFRQFTTLKPESTYFPETRWWWRDAAGIDLGEQLPWFLPEQRIVWNDDSYRNICEAWEQFANK